MISIKISETYKSDWYNEEELLEFFSEYLVLVHTLLQERGFLPEKRDFDTVQIMKHAILGLLGHET